MKETEIVKNLFSFSEFAKRYKKGERIFDSVLRRQFRQESENCAEYLVKNGIAKEMTLLRCPHCMREVAVVDKPERLKNRHLCCSHCDRECTAEQLIPEFVLIKN